MKLQPPARAPEQEQKLIVLQCLAQFGPCTELQLLQFLFEHDLMNYFDMMFALNELCDQGQAARGKAPAGYRYELTEAGRETLQLFGNRVPQSVMTLLRETGEQWKTRFRQEAVGRAELRPAGQGECDAVLEVRDQDRALMTLTLRLPRELAAQIAEAWPGKAEEMYGAVIRRLAEEEP